MQIGKMMAIIGTCSNTLIQYKSTELFSELMVRGLLCAAIGEVMDNGKIEKLIRNILTIHM